MHSFLKDLSKMSALKSLNPKAEIMNRSAALFMNINAAKGLEDVMKTNLGPTGTIKMLVGGAGGAFFDRMDTPHGLRHKCCVGRITCTSWGLISDALPLLASLCGISTVSLPFMAATDCHRLKH